jgi:hypothetical protein
MERHEAITSETLPFGLGMLWDWDWRAEAVQAAFDRLAPANSSEPEAASVGVSL